jgi:hypothetical protein
MLLRSPHPLHSVLSDASVHGDWSERDVPAFRPPGLMHGELGKRGNL